MKAKRLPRLWCALQGLLPFEACVAAQRGELAWPAGEDEGTAAVVAKGMEGPARRRGDAVETRRAQRRKERRQ